ncbi:hypothetical protein [Janibacter anophelis]|uniref:hypothetical protein n=1 Tax=Janibacter anophelis TaxID=319054 RepID=UPI000DF00550|nr:hypothetical protein [Janibacter anophelis]
MSTLPPSATCPRLTHELAVLAAMPHTEQDDYDRRVADHEMWHDCHAAPPPVLPRDPDPGGRSPPT